MDDNNDKLKERLDDYAKTALWNNFVDHGGKIEDYNRYSEVKEDLEKSEKFEQKEKDLENN